jgi:hypothetical protein
VIFFIDGDSALALRVKKPVEISNFLRATVSAYSMMAYSTFSRRHYALIHFSRIVLILAAEL